MANSWITLSDSIASKQKRFIVLFPGYDPFKERKETVRTTVDGDYDICRGSIKKTFAYVLRVKIEETDPLYGTQSDLEYFYDLNSPNGSPSDKLTLVDHYGNTWIVSMSGRYDPQVQTVYLDGEYAFANIPVTLRVIQQVIDSGS